MHTLFNFLKPLCHYFHLQAGSQGLERLTLQSWTLKPGCPVPAGAPKEVSRDRLGKGPASSISQPPAARPSQVILATAHTHRPRGANMLPGNAYIPSPGCSLFTTQRLSSEVRHIGRNVSTAGLPFAHEWSSHCPHPGPRQAHSCKLQINPQLSLLPSSAIKQGQG